MTIFWNKYKNIKLKKKIVKYLRKQQGIVKVILFGSRATNNYRKNSDCDLCIIIDTLKIREQIIFKLGQIMMQDNIIIHPFIFEKNDFEHKKHINIYETQMLNKGIVLIDNVKSD